VGLAGEVPEGTCVHGKGIAIVAHRIAKEKRNLEVGEIAWIKAADGIHLPDVINIYSLVLQTAGNGPMIFQNQGQVGACTIRKTDGIPCKMFGSAEYIELKVVFATGTHSRQNEPARAFWVRGFCRHVGMCL
jgi:hypothetical protein